MPDMPAGLKTTFGSDGVDDIRFGHFSPTEPSSSVFVVPSECPASATHKKYF